MRVERHQQSSKLKMSNKKTQLSKRKHPKSKNLLLKSTMPQQKTTTTTMAVPRYLQLNDRYGQLS